MLAHESRQLPSWLIFDVGRRMRLRHHIVVIVGVAVLFCGMLLVLGARISDKPSWYEAPILFPLVVAIWVGGDAHNPSVIAGNVAWALECLFIGIVVDACVVLARRRSENRKPGHR